KVEQAGVAYRWIHDVGINLSLLFVFIWRYFNLWDLFLRLMYGINETVFLNSIICLCIQYYSAFPSFLHHSYICMLPASTLQKPHADSFRPGLPNPQSITLSAPNASTGYTL